MQIKKRNIKYKLLINVLGFMVIGFVELNPYGIAFGKSSNL